MSGAGNARSIPIPLVEAGIDWLRRSFFSVSRGESVKLVVTGDYGHVDGGEWWQLPLYHEVLGPAGFAGPWERSYHYEGEDVNLVRFYYDPARYPELPNRQDHIRLFIDEYPPGEIGIAPHSEASALAHKEAHVNDVGYDAGRGKRRLVEILKDAGVQYRLE